ncbi:MAG: hypothetical protein WKF54_04145 [Nocardioidaceae bacterium]
MTYDAAPSPRGSVPALPAAPTRPVGWESDSPVLVDCDTCSVRGLGCGDCVVTVLLGGPPSGVVLNEEERRALEVLAAAGLVPPLRLVQGIDSEVVDLA